MRTFAIESKGKIIVVGAHDEHKDSILAMIAGREMNKEVVFISHDEYTTEYDSTVPRERIQDLIRKLEPMPRMETPFFDKPKKPHNDRNYQRHLRRKNKWK